ncbi:MAG: AI-2E family transporter [Balneolaceae bacterium]|nr:AI-2E family transporter [Balneolaceae bacterium]
MPKEEQSNILRIAAVLLIAVLVVYIMVEASLILVPLAWSLFLSLLLLPVVQWLEDKKIPRFLAIISVLVLVSVILTVILYLLSLQVAGLLGDTPLVTANINQWVVDFQEMLQRRFNISRELFTQQLSSSLTDMINSALREVRNSLFSLFRTVTLISIVPLFIFFMLYYRDVFYEGFLRIVKSYRSEASYLVNKVNKVLQKYLTGVMLVTLIIGVMFYVVLLLFGLNYALFFAVFLAIFNLIPYIGVIIASFAVVLYAFAVSNSLLYPVGVLLALWIIQIIENNFITPYIVGSRVKLNPMVALIAILVGSNIWGISGMILFLPLVGAIKVVFDEIEGLRPYGLLLGSTTNQHPNPDSSSETQ